MMEAALRAYRDWLSALPREGFDPYYSEEAVRFEPRETDVLVGPGDVTARAAPCGCLLESARAAVSMTVCGIEPNVALACFAAVDGTGPLSTARALAAVPADKWRLFLERAFGKLVFAPLALSELERCVSHAEIVRFPGSPYEIVRPYWENMRDVRLRLDGAGECLDEPGRFERLVAELNVLTHVGRSGGSFYRPASPISAKEELLAGAFWRTPSVTEETPAGVRFVSGPRVGAALIGGERYHRLLASSSGDDGALLDARSIAMEGLSWGRVVTARADGDEAPAPWFCPPRPFAPAHVESIRAALATAHVAAREGRTDDAVRGAASVHWRFVRLHPFMSGNQSVAMALVNGVLRRALGVGIPHLVLDHLALRLSLPAYERTFERAVRAWALCDENPVRRALELAARRRRIFGFIEDLGRCAAGDVAAFLVERRNDAELAFLPASAVP